MNEVLRLTLPPEAAGQRMDKAIALAAPQLSRARIQALMAAGEVEVGGEPALDASAKARAGAEVVITLPPPDAATPAPQELPLTILFEDADLIVIDKAAGMAAHPAPGTPDGTLVNALLHHCGASLSGIGGVARPGIVHRLDKDTSGIMLVAKTQMALAALSADFAARRIERAYLALCWGLLSPTSGDLEGAIGRDPRDRKRMTIVGHGGKAALTHYRTLRVMHAAVSLIECRLATGRTHQIRVHLSQNGHALLGDPVYLRRVPAAARLLPPASRRAALDFPRQALHAASLGFTHPRTGEILRFETAPPSDFNALLTCITANSGM